MTDLQAIVRAIRALPAEGDGMTVGDIAETVGTDTGHVVSALEDMVERDGWAERADSPAWSAY